MRFPDNVLNDNSVIMANISQTETSIETILREKLNLLLDRTLQKPQILAPTVNTALQMTFLTRLFMKVH